ncbi:hypothetical protein HED60_16830 [Planctomycetales bacterium ZRK34]|nr:hypothetical protein HED60_16830 [Planctomycetales bacterium ZRK34]
MKRTELACYTLLASAIVLTALLFVQAQRFVDTTAHAEMVVNKDFTTMLSAQFRTDSEIIYVLDSKQARLIAYIMDTNRKRVERIGEMDVADMFNRWLNSAEGRASQRGGGGARQSR